MKVKRLKLSEKESDSKGEDSFLHINNVAFSSDETPSLNIDINSVTDKDLFEEIDTSSIKRTDLDCIEREIDMQEVASILEIVAENNEGPIGPQLDNPIERERILISTFCMRLLKNPEIYGSHDWVTWLDRENGIFQVLKPDLVAQVWAEIKENRVSSWKNFKRSIRSVTGDEEKFYFQSVPDVYENVTHVIKFHQRLRDQWM